MYNTCSIRSDTIIMSALLRYALVEWPHLAAQVTRHRDRVVIVYEEGRTLAVSAPLANWKAGMPLGRARSLYAHAVFEPRNHAREKAAHNALARRLIRFSPRMEAVRQGCFLLQDPDIYGLAEFVAQHVELRAAAASHADWTHMAASLAPPATLRIVCNKAAFLAETPVFTLDCGILGDDGAEVAERLRLFGLNDLNAVRSRLNRRHLRAQFGAEIGALLDRILRPGREPVVSVYKPDREVYVTHELEISSPAGKPWIRAAILRLAEHLVSSRYMASRGLSSATDLQRLASRLHESLCHRLAMHDILSLRLAAGDLVPRAYTQGDLFTPRTEEPALLHAVHQLQQRYGHQALLRVEQKDSLFPEERLVLKPLR